MDYLTEINIRIKHYTFSNWKKIMHILRSKSLQSRGSSMLSLLFSFLKILVLNLGLPSILEREEKVERSVLRMLPEHRQEGPSSNN